jgi:hypothetical protein
MEAWVRVKVPKVLFPEPQDKPTRADLLQLQENPAFLLILARLQQRAVVYRFPNDDEKLTTEARVAQGVNDALEVIDRVINSGTTDEEE